MSKLTLLLLVLFVAALALLAVVFTHPLLPTATLSKVTKMLASPPGTALTMSPANVTLSASGSAQIAINVDTGRDTIGTAQLAIGYDPRVLLITAISPGTFFARPDVLLSDIDSTDGRITFAETTNGAEQKGTGTLATLTVWVRYPLLADHTSLIFYPKTAVMHLNESRSLIASESGATILFPIFRPQTVGSGSALSLPPTPATGAAY